MAEYFIFEVHTPYRLFFKDKVEAISITLLDGEIGVYAHHSPFTAPVKPCLIRIKEKNGQWKTGFSSEGILEVTGSKTVLMVDAAEWPNEIDHGRALEAKQKAEADLKDSSFKFESEASKLRLGRAEMRLKVWELRTEKSPGQ
jgi:F-type H+-transporting ATPase subunit epsilon